MGDTVANVGFWPDGNPGNPPTVNLKLRLHQASLSVDHDEDVEDDADDLYAAAKNNDRTSFNTIMSGYTVWGTLNQAKQDTAWASIRRPHL